jgi:excisionase family DNA binding protein
MCSGVVFLLGLFVFFRGGQFTFNGHTVPKERGRLIAGIIMLPFVFGVLAGGYLGLRGGPNMTLDTLMQSGSSLFIIEILMLVVVVGVALYMIYTSPAEWNPSPRLTNTPIPKDVMTPAEAAIYLRVTEPDIIALIDGGHLPAARIAGQYRIARRAVDDYLSSQRAGNPFEEG